MRSCWQHLVYGPWGSLAIGWALLVVVKHGSASPPRPFAQIRAPPPCHIRPRSYRAPSIQWPMSSPLLPRLTLCRRRRFRWSRGVTVSTLDSESSDRGSNPRGTFLCILRKAPQTCGALSFVICRMYTLLLGLCCWEALLRWYRDMKSKTAPWEARTPDLEVNSLTL